MTSDAPQTPAERIANNQSLVRSLVWQIQQQAPGTANPAALTRITERALVEAANSYEPLRDGDFAAFLSQRIRTVVADARRQAQQLIVGCQGLVRSLAFKIHRKLPSTVDLDDLIGYGQIGLAEAARDFDSTRGIQFTTFAYYRVRGAILDGLSKMQWFNRSDYERGRYERLSHEILGVDGAEAPSVDSVDSELGWLKGASSALAMVYLVGQREGDQESGEAALEDTKTIAPEDQVLTKEMGQKLHELIDALPPEQGRLIRAAYFEGLTLKEAGERINVSKAWASRLHAKTLQSLARSLRSMQMAD